MSEKIEDAPLRMGNVFKEASLKDQDESGQGRPSLNDSRDNADCSCLPEALGRSNFYSYTLLSKCLM